MRIHLPFLQPKIPLHNRINDSFRRAYEEINNTQINKNYNQIPHINKFYSLLLYFNTPEKRINFTLKLLAKCIGNKEVISFTRSKFAHGRMPGDLNKKSRDDLNKEMRYEYERTRRVRDPNTGQTIFEEILPAKINEKKQNYNTYDIYYSLYCLYPMYINIMNCGEFAKSTNVLSLYFLEMLKRYEIKILNGQNPFEFTVTPSYLEMGDHAFNIVRLTLKNGLVIKLFVDSFYRTVRTQNEFNAYLARCKFAYEAQFKLSKLSYLFNKNIDLDSSFVKQNSTLKELTGFVGFESEDCIQFISKVLEKINFEEMINKTHKEYHTYLHRDKDIPREAYTI
ncbi:hypothetical protein [Silvanigrella aquatica]|uniref:Uncharacterized protein n=1 Tax=Silvanigrella aquatica TaxID=1915309 RepID=A0A1L4CYH4_9BACT|nr:hypothetical protein [Silvanigrella aquatica]APJ03008.1 hypothetical protein AXG55_03390 [Silvanigrella aquatica]